MGTSKTVTAYLTIILNYHYAINLDEVVSCDTLPIPAVWARELIRHSNQQPVQSRDTAATFLVVCMVEWVGLRHNNVSRDYPEVSVRSGAGLNIHEYGTA